MRYQLVEQRTIDHVSSAEDPVIRYTRDADSNITHVRRGSAATRSQLGPLDEQIDYDGFGRARAYRDQRGTAWQVAYTPLGDVSAIKQSDTPYGSPDNPEWQIAIAYDELRRPVHRNFHGLVDETTRYDEAGNPVEVTRTGEGTTFRTFDNDGNVVWQLDPAGTQIVTTFDPLSRIGFTSTIHEGAAGPLTTTVEGRLDGGYETAKPKMGQTTVQGLVRGRAWRRVEPCVESGKSGTERRI